MLSIVIPVYNEEEVIPRLVERLKHASRAWGDYEIIFVDDGSSDRTLALLEKAHREEGYKFVSFSRNFGHQIAVSAGLEMANGDKVAVIDGDLQDPPEFIETMLTHLGGGIDIVYAVRQNRKESFPVKLAYAIFYRLLRRMTHIDIPLDAGDFCLMDKKVVRLINSLPERNRFIRGLRAWTGFRAIGVPYNRDARTIGSSKYTLGKLIKLAFDGFTGFSTVPLKLATYAGLFFAGASFSVGLVFLIIKLTGGVAVPGWTSLILVIFFIGGIELFVLGLLGEYIGRMYEEIKGRPLYVIKASEGLSRAHGTNPSQSA